MVSLGSGFRFLIKEFSNLFGASPLLAELTKLIGFFGGERGNI
jgi:hypothetical protein